ncbi:MAG: hypothetical protein L3K09_06275 [Thermoplasmata archaeon]|nr:hypothetical protein [Thermoplasmata archaeon]
MGLVVEWGNLGSVALPFFIALTGSAVLALLLRNASDVSGLPRSRERCVGCRFESALVRDGLCRQTCTVNELPTLPIVLFLSTGTVAILCLFFPQVMIAFVLPFAIGSRATPQILLALLGVANTGACALIAGYFVQDLPKHRELFGFIAVFGTLLGLLVGFTVPGPVGLWARSLTPLALGLTLLFSAVEHRARMGRPTFGLRALGASVVPLFLVFLLATVRMAEIFHYAYGSL